MPVLRTKTSRMWLPDVYKRQVQFHPEANGGPKDTEFLFDQFVSRMLAAKGVINNA